MTVELMMPALSPTMEKGTLARWLVSVGDNVAPGDLLAEVETDKATMELEASEGGRLLDLVVAAGTDDIPVGTVIARFAAAGDTVAEATVTKVAERAEPVRAVEPYIAPPHAASAVEDRQSGGLIAVPQTTTLASSTLNATPLAHRIARANGIDLSRIVGTGARGRIVKADLGLRDQRTSSHVPILSPSEEVQTVSPPAGVPVETVKLSTMRRTIARRLGEAKRTVPHLYLTVRCRLDPLMRLRGELNLALGERGVKLSVNDMVMKAMAMAMRDEPGVNVQYGGDVLHRFSRVDLAMAVAIDGGLVTPVIRGIDDMSLSAIATESQRLTAKARAGDLAPEENQGGTASISNLGMFDVDEIVPVINPPQALILGLGAGVEQPWKLDGGVGLATIMAATASFDHRVVDGTVGARFIAALRERLEAPMTICA